jgi:hypothetical protein
MQRRKQTTQPHDHSEQQLAGLRKHAEAQKQNTIDRLRAAITSLNAQNKPISAKTIYEECGLEYAALRRNPEALLLYQQQSTFLKRERKRMKAPPPEAPSPRDPLLAYKKTQLATQVHEERKLRQEMEAQHAQLLQEYVQKDIKIAELEAELAQYRGYLERLRISIQQQEQSN